MRTHLGLMSLGVFLIIVALWVAAWLFDAISAADLVPLILLSSGVWVVANASVRAARHDENTGAFSTFGWGMLFIVLGGSLLLVNTGMNPLLTVVFILALIGVLTVVTAFRSRRN